MSESSTKQSWARGGLVFAGTMMIIIGVFQLFEGIAAIAKDQFFVVGANYAYSVDTTTWGWIHLGLGILVAAAGLYLFTGSTAARVIGIALVSLSAIANFFFIPYYPVWAVLIIAMEIFVIWSLATVRTGASADLMSDSYSGQAGTYGSAGSYGSGPRAGDPNRTGTEERWPTENAAAGRHWAPDNVKEGVDTGTGSMQGGSMQGGQGSMQGGQGSMQGGQGSMGESEDAARERAAAAGRNQPPPNR